ncbi:MAG: MotA/TolQ/ExbB proton channel family protein, partial [Desulfobacterium sp.]|nr:MotA/TolQ/ExbB proton channel family protein [Desulfobacterium sp.]
MKLKENICIFSVTALILISLLLSPVFAQAKENNTDAVTPAIEAIGELPEPFDGNSGKSIENPGAVQTAETAKNDAPGNKPDVAVMSLLDIIKKGGFVGYLIILLSILALGLIIDYALTIRKIKILPPKDVEALDKIIKDRNLDEIKKFDMDKASYFTKITIAGLKESKMGYQDMIKAMEDAGEAMTSAIARKIEHLNVIGNIAPMMGLLGTVTGMLRCFNEIAHVPGAIEPKQLAGGIFEALITTCMGLIVAIPSLYGYAVFKNRIDEFTAEAALAAEQLVSS